MNKHTGTPLICFLSRFLAFSILLSLSLSLFCVNIYDVRKVALFHTGEIGMRIKPSTQNGWMLQIKVFNSNGNQNFSLISWIIEFLQNIVKVLVQIRSHSTITYTSWVESTNAKAHLFSLFIYLIIRTKTKTKIKNTFNMYWCYCKLQLYKI